MADDVFHDRSTIALLEKLGISRNEVKCYLASLLLGHASVRDVAARGGVHRVNAYSAVRGLVERGLVRQEVRGGVRTVVAEPLDRLDTLAQEHQKHATRLRWKVADLVPALAKVSAQARDTQPGDIGDVLFFRGDDAFYRVADRTLEAAPRGSTMLFLDNSDYFHSSDNPKYDDEYYIPRRLERRIRARVLYHDARDPYAVHLYERDAEELRETRLLPSNMAFPCSMYIYGTEVALVWTTSQTYGLVIQGGPLNALMHTIFELIWNVSSPAGRKRGRNAARASNH